MTSCQTVNGITHISALETWRSCWVPLLREDLQTDRKAKAREEQMTPSLRRPTSSPLDQRCDERPQREAGRNAKLTQMVGNVKRGFCFRTTTAGLTVKEINYWVFYDTFHFFFSPSSSCFFNPFSDPSTETFLPSSHCSNSLNFGFISLCCLKTKPIHELKDR